MKYSGILQKMRTEYGNPIQYFLDLNNQVIRMNDLIGNELEINYLKKIHCLHCGKITSKSFGQGYCYPCFSTSPETSPCVLKPELCEAHLGISRNMEWSEKYCLQKHIVYLAVSGNLKVGVTRFSQIPTRWIDQGASRAIKFAETPNRFLAGVIEKELMQFVSDKTNWQKMLKNQVDNSVDLLKEKEEKRDLLPNSLIQYYCPDNEIIEMYFPVEKYPKKIESTNFEKVTNIKSVLSGIKGQYLLFENQSIFNVRTHSGYEVELIFS